MVIIKGSESEVVGLCREIIYGNSHKIGGFHDGDIVTMYGVDAKLEFVEEPESIKQMREEYKELNERIKKLQEYKLDCVHSCNGINTLSELTYISVQIDAMQKYAKAISDRALLAGFPLELKESNE